MIGQLLKSLLEIFRQDIQDYTEMKYKMREFSSFLFETAKVSPDNKVGKEIKGEKSPIKGISLESGLEQYDQTVQEFSTYRQEIFNRLKQRADRANDIQVRACSEIGEELFQLSKFKPFVEETLYNELSSLTEELRAEMAEILEMDKVILKKLQTELNVLRLEVHRIEGVKKTRTAYENKANTDALFIDRKK